MSSEGPCTFYSFSYIKLGTIASQTDRGNLNIIRSFFAFLSGGVEIKKSPSPRKQEVAAKAKLPKAPLGVGESKLSLVLGSGRDKTPPARKKKRSLSIEMYDGSSTPPKRFSNVPPPRVSIII